MSFKGFGEGPTHVWKVDTPTLADFWKVVEKAKAQGFTPGTRIKHKGVWYVVEDGAVVPVKEEE